jgi:hypothetical protein
MRSDRFWKTEVELDVHINIHRIPKLCSRLHEISGEEEKNCFGRHGREKQLSTSSCPGNRRTRALARQWSFLGMDDFISTSNGSLISI